MSAIDGHLCIRRQTVLMILFYNSFHLELLNCIITLVTAYACSKSSFIFRLGKCSVIVTVEV